MSPWMTSSLTRLGRWLVRKTRQVQHNMSIVEYLAGEEYKPKA